MSGRLTLLWLAILIGWIAFGLIDEIAPPLVAAGLAAVAGALVVHLYRDTALLRGVVAVFGPIAVVLPMLALREVAKSMGLPVQSFGTAPLVVFLIAYVVFLIASAGVLPFDPYRLGYSPGPVAVMVLAICAWGAIQGNLFLPLLAVLAQALWLAGRGSSNWFDHMLHVLLVPIVVVALLGRLLA